MKKFRYLFAIYIITPLILGLVFTGCEDNDDDNNDNDDNIDPHTTTPWTWPIEKLAATRFPTEMNIPADNPMTVEGVEFGRWLFYDGRMSGRTHQDSLMSCATCHIQRNSFEAGIDHPKFPNGHPFGLEGKPTPHVMLPMINLVYNFNGYLWNGKVNKDNTFQWKDDPRFDMTNIESLLWMGIVAEHEMLGHPDRSAALINTIPKYRELCYEAFGDSNVTYERMNKAVAQFVRTLISYNCKFHKVIRGEASFAPAEARGFTLFVDNNGADCFHCHGESGNTLMTTNLFYNNGLDTGLTVDSDPGDRYHVTGDPKDIGAYKATTLINCELYGPYMHDGRFSTLEEVIDQYSDNVKNTDLTHPLMELAFQGGAKLTASEKSDLLAFLKTLTDNDFITNPAFAKPDGLDDKWVNQD